MPIKPNATFTFRRYTVVGTSIELHFVCGDPGPGESTDYTVTLLDSELATVTNASQLLALVTAKLQRLIRASGIASKLDPFIGQSVTI